MSKSERGSKRRCPPKCDLAHFQPLRLIGSILVYSSMNAYYMLTIMKRIFLDYLHAGLKTTIQRNAKAAAIAVAVSLLLLQANQLLAQTAKTKQRIVVDVAHGQRFWKDAASVANDTSAPAERVRYLNGELAKNAASLNATVNYLNTAITPTALANCDVLFIHIPSAKYTPTETKAIQQYIGQGGSLFLVMDADYWSTLEQVNANDIVSPFGITFKGDNPDGQSSGGYSSPGKVASKRFSIPYHGARVVEGGTPFCFSNQTEKNPFGVYTEAKNGGRIIAMGDGMVSLYMNSWQGVNDYQCAPFMQDALAWLLK
jgi:hypothetical protein